MAVNEGQRQAYLRELGIQPYFPRRALPGATPSPRYATGALVAPEDRAQNAEANVKRLSALVGSATSARMETAAVAAPPFASKLAPTGASVGAAVEAAGAFASKLAPTGTEITPPAPRASAVRVAPTPTPTPAPATAPAVPENPVEEARFAFAYFPISEDLAVINELPWAKSAAVAPACRQLLAAILKALSVPCEEKALTSMVFTWPLDDASDADRSAQSARHMLDGFMARRFKLRPVRHLLILAEQSAGYLFPTDFDWHQEGMKRHPHHAVDVVLTRSLNAMDAVPDIKRSVWQALQPLRAALAHPAPDADGTDANGQ